MERDLIDAEALRHWLGAAGLTIDGSPDSGGWSNDTVLVTADQQPLVVRLTPRGRSMFPTYDLGHQVRAMDLARRGGVPVPAVLGREDDPAVLGRPFFVMERVAGRVPGDDDPPFTRAGFLHDAPPQRQRHFHDEVVTAIAAIHAVAPPSFEATGPQPVDHLDACRDLATWCEWTPAIVMAAETELRRDVPTADPEHCGLLWGDARPANVVVDDDFGVAALLDWELAANGPGELDIAWFCEMNHMRSTGMGIAPLPGFPDEDGTWALWQDRVGREAEHRPWYRRFSAYRVAAFMQLYLAAMVHRGRIPADHRVLADNPGTRRLQELFD